MAVVPSPVARTDIPGAIRIAAVDFDDDWKLLQRTGTYKPPNVEVEFESYWLNLRGYPDTVYAVGRSPWCLLECTVISAGNDSVRYQPTKILWAAGRGEPVFLASQGRTTSWKSVHLTMALAMRELQEIIREEVLQTDRKILELQQESTRLNGLLSLVESKDWLAQ